MFKLNWINIKSGLIYGLLWALLVVTVTAIEVGDLFALDWKNLLNVGIFTFLGIFVSLLKNLLTTDSGNFLNVVKVIPPTDEK